MASEANRDLGVFLIFTGLVGSLPLYYLFCTLILQSPVWDWRHGAVLGLVLVALGYCLVAFTRRTFRVRDRAVEVRDGLLRRPIRYAFQEAPRVRLQVLEIEGRGRPRDYWQVMLVDGKYEYLLDSRPEQMQESRCLAEFIAKQVGCPLKVRLEAGQAFQIEAADLDLPFAELVKRYPELLGPRLPRPECCPIREEGQGAKRRFRWGMRTSSLLNETVGLFAVALAVGFVPMSNGEEARSSLFDLARSSHDYAYFMAVGALFLLALFLQFGYQVQVNLTPDKVGARTTLWGVPIWSASIATSVLEGISVRTRSQGAFLQFVSDERIVSLRVLRRELADYLGSELRHALAGRPDESPQ